MTGIYSTLAKKKKSGEIEIRVNTARHADAC